MRTRMELAVDMNRGTEDLGEATICQRFFISLVISLSEI